MYIYIWIMLIAVIASAILMVYAVANNNSEKAFFLIFSSVCTFLYTVGYLLEMISPTLEAAFMGVRVQKIGNPFIVILNYLFLRDVYGEKRFSRRMYCLLFALPLFNMFTIQAFPLVKLHYTHIQYFHNGFIANCHGYAGPMSYIATGYNFVLLSLTLRRILKNLKRGGKLQRHQNLCLLISILIPFVVNVYHTLSYNYLRLDLNPFAVSVSAALLLYSVRIQNLLNAVPLARAQVIESMTDAFIVCGRDFTFLDANQAAKELFPELNTLPPGETMERMKVIERESELALPINGEMRFYKITQTPIFQNSKNSGICIVFHDITDKENQLKQLYGKATFDPLLHIYNRASFFDRANSRLSEDTAKNNSYGLLMIDLDHFKQVNDTYGHSCGDIVLETIAVIVKGHFRKSDLAGRYGGEEIVVLLENILSEKMVFLVEKLCRIIEDTTISCQENNLHVTVSIGMAYSPAGGSHSLDDMLIQADSALYKAKNNGRNRSLLYKETEGLPVTY